MVHSSYKTPTLKKQIVLPLVPQWTQNHLEKVPKKPGMILQIVPEQRLVGYYPSTLQTQLCVLLVSPYHSFTGLNSVLPNFVSLLESEDVPLFENWVTVDVIAYVKMRSHWNNMGP